MRQASLTAFASMPLLRSVSPNLRSRKSIGLHSKEIPTGHAHQAHTMEQALPQFSARPAQAGDLLAREFPEALTGKTWLIRSEACHRPAGGEALPGQLARPKAGRFPQNQ